jgi:diaminopimelate decarboxylase
MQKNIPFSLTELENLKNKYETPYYIYDGDSIKHNAIQYIIMFKKYFPNFKQYFAVKACPNPSILKLLYSCGMNFDCSSPEEIKIVKMINNSAEIFYTSNYTSQKDLSYALKISNLTINLDDIDGFYNLLNTKKTLPELICFRYNPLINSNTDIKSNNLSGIDTKFGMEYQKILNSYKLAKKYNIKRFGIHCMCISNQLDINFWSSLIDNIFVLINELYKKYLIKIEFVNIGGGLGIPYSLNDKKINLEDLVINIRNSFDKNINLYKLDFEPNLYTESGRYITGPYGYLVSTCESIKEKDNGKIFGLDANMANLMRPGMYNAYHLITIPRLYNEKNFISANVVGTLCENNDWFAKNRNLPINITKKDLFVIHDVGAHGFSMGFNYNSKLRSCELLKLNNRIIKIRDRETFDDLFHNTLEYKIYNNNNINIILSLILFYFIFFLII